MFWSSQVVLWTFLRAVATAPPPFPATISSSMPARMSVSGSGVAAGVVAWSVISQLLQKGKVRRLGFRGGQREEIGNRELTITPHPRTGLYSRRRGLFRR